MDKRKKFETFFILFLPLLIFVGNVIAGDLTGKSPANTYKQILNVGNNNVGLTSSTQRITDGEGNNLPVTVSSTIFNFDSGSLYESGTRVSTEGHTHLITDVTDITATDSEINVLDGILASTAELNYLSGVTSAIQTQIDSKKDDFSVLPISEGGTGQTTSVAALNALLPSQSGNSGYYLQTNGSASAWAEVPSQALAAYYYYVRAEYASASTIKILDGSMVRSSDNTSDIILSSDITIDITASGANGLDTGSEANSTWYYPYLIYNPTTDTEAGILSVTNEADTGSITLPADYTVKRQLRFAVYNNGSGDFLVFVYYPGEDRIKYLYPIRDQAAGVGAGDVLEVLDSGVQTTYTAVALSGLVPPISTRVQLYLTANETTGTLRSVFLRNPAITTEEYELSVINANAKRPMTLVEVGTNTSQQVEYRVGNASASETLYVAGYYNTVVK